eukprot:2782622-Pyramimonas_sp.AAC.2
MATMTSSLRSYDNARTAGWFPCPSPLEPAALCVCGRLMRDGAHGSCTTRPWRPASPLHQLTFVGRIRPPAAPRVSLRLMRASLSW